MTVEGSPIVRVSGLHKYFGQNHVLRGVDLARRAQAKPSC